mmetsp:Transcript_23021/g.51927  ORF Transcript_23021/g.51927 Transcript_23021/m.51927 type:complete len:218 (-) Transcript_23021:146-799(-)
MRLLSAFSSSSSSPSWSVSPSIVKALEDRELSLFFFAARFVSRLLRLRSRSATSGSSKRALSSDESAAPLEASDGSTSPKSTEVAPNFRTAASALGAAASGSASKGILTGALGSTPSATAAVHPAPLAALSAAAKKAEGSSSSTTSWAGAGAGAGAGFSATGSFAKASTASNSVMMSSTGCFGAAGAAAGVAALAFSFRLRFFAPTTVSGDLPRAGP